MGRRGVAPAGQAGEAPSAGVSGRPRQSDGEAAAKRVTKAMWVLLKTHPDCRVLVGQFPDQVAERLARCEVECEKRSAMITALRSERAKLMEGLDEEPEPDEDEDLILGEPAPEVKGTP